MGGVTSEEFFFFRKSMGKEVLEVRGPWDKSLPLSLSMSLSTE